MTIVARQPDGGYGWVIVFASALTNFITLSIVQCFGLILKDIFADMHLSATQTSILINLNGAFGMVTGPLTAILHKLFGCRKTAMFSALLLTVGMGLTSISSSFGYLVVTYGIISSLGTQMSEATCRLSINMYFKKKRSLVTGFVMTAAGFGPIFIPQLIWLLLKVYSINQVTLLYAGLCAHVFVAGVLLQPVEWHMVKEATNEETIELNVIQTGRPEEQTLCQRLIKGVTNFFDLDLLKDPIFDNILVGLALATFAEMNFTLLVPFILQDYGLSTSQIATFLSTLGVADMLSRFVAPYVGTYFTKPSRLMFTYALVVLILIKFTILWSSNFYVLLIIAFALGIAKGIRKVYMWLVIPDYVSMDKLPSAGGMDMLARGICIVVGGIILGTLRDATGSYEICIIIMNCVTIFSITLWAVEAVIVKYKKRKLAEKIQQDF